MDIGENIGKGEKVDKITDKELEEFINDKTVKDIDQTTSIDEQKVNEHLQSMGYLWDAVQTKLKEDAVCFNCKRSVDFSSEKLNVREASKVDKGVCAFLAICEKCLK